MITSDSMVDRLMHIPQEELAEMCCAAHEDQYGFKGRHCRIIPGMRKLNAGNRFVLSRTRKIGMRKNLPLGKLCARKQFKKEA